MIDKTKRLLLTYKEAQAITGLSEHVLRTMCRKRVLVGRRISHKRFVITMASIERFVSSIDNEGRFKSR